MNSTFDRSNGWSRCSCRGTWLFCAGSQYLQQRARWIAAEVAAPACRSRPAHEDGITFVSTRFRLWMICPGRAPMYVRRWPRSSASSCKVCRPARCARTCASQRPSHTAAQRGSCPRPEARRSYSVIGPSHVRLQPPHAQVIQNALLHLPSARSGPRPGELLRLQDVHLLAGALRPRQAPPATSM